MSCCARRDTSSSGIIRRNQPRSSGAALLSMALPSFSFLPNFFTCRPEKGDVQLHREHRPALLLSLSPSLPSPSSTVVLSSSSSCKPRIFAVPKNAHTSLFVLQCMCARASTVATLLTALTHETPSHPPSPPKCPTLSKCSTIALHKSYEGGPRGEGGERSGEIYPLTIEPSLRRASTLSSTKSIDDTKPMLKASSPKEHNNQTSEASGQEGGGGVVNDKN